MRALVMISGLATAGAERVTVSFLQQLQRAGYQASACTVTNRHDGPLAKELQASGVVRHDLNARRLADPQALVRLLGLIKRKQPNIIHAHGQDATILANMARLMSTKPLVITRHVLDEPQESWRQVCRAQMVFSAMRRADAVVAVSEATANRLIELTKLPRQKILVIPNGVDLEAFREPTLLARGAQLRKKLGFSPMDRVVLLPAALRDGKGHDTLLAALQPLQQNIPSLRLVFAGSGDRKSLLQERAKSFGEKVLFLGNYPDMPVLLSSCDLVALPSSSEALPTVLIEAAAAGRPVVATRVGGTAEVVRENHTGLLVPPNDPPALATAIAELLNNPKRLREFGSIAQLHAKENFAIELQVKRTLELWSKVLDRGA